MTTRRTPLRRILPLIISVGLITGVVYLWGDTIWTFITGQDIMDELTAELAAAQRPTATPASGSSNPAPTADPAGTEITIRSEAEIAPDGFPIRARQHVMRYVVQEGDALTLIAERFGLNANTIFWANTETLQDNVHLIHVGSELYILPDNGVYHLSDGIATIGEIAASYNVSAGDILYSEYNTLSDFDSAYTPPPGLRLVIPGGRREFISWQAPIRSGTQTDTGNPEGSYHPGACRELYNGTGGLGAYTNPMGATPYRVTNGFEPWHPGVDLAADRDTPVYAAETGVVVFAGWHRDGYGELIILDHGDGWTTYYGHLARRYVGCGDQVSKGQFIADMGMSGNATGIHLHFEVRENDEPLNPYQFFVIEDMRGR